MEDAIRTGRTRRGFGFPVGRVPPRGVPGSFQPRPLLKAICSLLFFLLPPPPFESAFNQRRLAVYSSSNSDRLLNFFVSFCALLWPLQFVRTRRQTPASPADSPFRRLSNSLSLRSLHLPRACRLSPEHRRDGGTNSLPCRADLPRRSIRAKAGATQRRESEVGLPAVASAEVGRPTTNDRCAPLKRSNAGLLVIHKKVV
jgi:hypothetical protein